MVDQNAAGALNHAFGQTGGPGGIHHVQGMIERQLLELYFKVGFGRSEIPVMDGIGNRTDIRILIGVGNHDHFFDGGKILQNVGNPFQGINFFTLERIPVGGK